jgi:predicted nucleic acid-binding protein
MAKICISTEVMLDFLTGDENTGQKIRMYTNDVLCITAITLFELRCVVDTAGALAEVLPHFNVLDFDQKSVEEASKIFRDSVSSGIARDSRQAIVAGICIANDALYFTKDRTGFDGIRGLKLV